LPRTNLRKDLLEIIKLFLFTCGTYGPVEKDFLKIYLVFVVFHSLFGKYIWNFRTMPTNFKEANPRYIPGKNSFLGIIVFLRRALKIVDT
jgi:hypothetical protein